MVEITAFEFASTPNIVFGCGAFAKLPSLIAEKGERVLLITGSSSLQKTGNLKRLTAELEEKVQSINLEEVSDEPSPELVNKLAEKFRSPAPSIIAAVGGGSVLDTGKAVSAMIPCEDSVMVYLEGVGEGKQHSGEKVPFIAVPTTSGTGSEATKNAVLSRVGENGFKKSLRHDNFVPDLALIDPELVQSCPPDITAASGMDAISQLLGAYVSTEASPLTDSLALKALEMAGNSYYLAVTEGKNLKARADMAYSALISGIVLANAGLGVVHGAASPLGGHFDIPHGVACGTLLPAAVNKNIELLRKEAREDRRTESYQFLEKFARAGALLNQEAELGRMDVEDQVEKYCDMLIDILQEWVEKLPISRLGEYSIREADLRKIAAETGCKNNPVSLSKEQIEDILRARL